MYEISYSSAVGLAIRYSKLGKNQEEPTGFHNVFLNESHKENSISLSAWRELLENVLS